MPTESQLSHPAASPLAADDDPTALRARLADAERRAEAATAALRRLEAQVEVERGRGAPLAAAGAASPAPMGEVHYRALVEQLPAIVYTAAVAPGYPTLYVTSQVERLLGFQPEEWVGHPHVWRERIHAADRERVERAWDAAHAAGRRFSAEYRMRARDGAVRWFRDEAELLRDAADTPLCIQGVMLDVTDRRLVEEELRHTQERWRAMIENAHDLTTILDPEGTTVYESPSVERVLGFRPEELVGRSAFVHMHPDDVPHVTAELARVMAEPGTTGRAEYRHRHRDGSWRHLEAFGRTLSPTSAAEGVVANVRDISERKAAEDALRTARERWQAMIENAHDIVAILDPEGRMGYQSPALTRVLGYTPEELAGQSAFAYMHPDDVPAVLAQLERVLATPGSVGHAEYRFRHRDGSWRHLEAFGRTLSPTSAAEGVVANVRDVSERRTAERALRESEEHFRQLSERGNDLLMISRSELGFGLSYVSPSVEHLLGYTPEEFLAFLPSDVLHPDDLAHVYAGMSEIFAVPGTVRRIEWRIRHKDGSWRHYDAIGRTLEPHSAARGAVCNCRDVTEQRAAEAALRQAKADAEQARAEAERANRAKSEFLSRMSHELRTPLNSILGFAQVLQDVELPRSCRTGVRHILNGGRHLLSLINEVLDIARIEAGEQALSLEPVHVGAALREAVDMVRPLAAAREVRVDLGPMPDAAGEGEGRYVRADRQRLAQVLLNLLSNAVKYNRPSGAVRLSAEARAEDDGVTRVRIRVADEGPGIAPDRCEQLFVPFARLGAEHTDVEGTGLGLALSQRLVAAMGGTLLLERSGPEGSVFAVDLPAAAHAHEAITGSGADALAPGTPTHAPVTLVYVEDNPANLDLVATFLERRPGWRLLPALRGRLGLELARRHRPDVVLLDLHLPDLSGEEVLRRLRADAATAALPVVVVTADATPRVRETLLRAGADAFLTKPLDVPTFLDTIDQVVGAARAAPAPPSSRA